VLIINAVTETTTQDEPATAAFVWDVAQEYNLNFPQVADPDQLLFDYSNSNSVSLPFHVAVDLRSMKIVATKEGRTSTAYVEQLADQTLLGPP